MKTEDKEQGRAVAASEQGQPLDVEALVSVIREFGYTTWGQSYEIAEAIARLLPSPPVKEQGNG
jgi:hypothetical protein